MTFSIQHGNKNGGLVAPDKQQPPQEEAMATARVLAQDPAQAQVQDQAVARWTKLVSTPASKPATIPAANMFATLPVPLVSTLAAKAAKLPKLVSLNASAATPLLPHQIRPLLPTFLPIQNPNVRETPAHQPNASAASRTCQLTS